MRKISVASIGMVPALLLISLTGCSTLFLPNEGVPIVHRVENPKDGTNISAVTAGRRMVFTKNMASDNVTCSEPPPDVAQAYSAALALSGERDKSRTLNLLKGDDKSDMSTDDKVKAAFNYGQATAQSELGPKSQALLLFRQGSFTLCQAYSNGAINGDARRTGAHIAVATRFADASTIEDKPSPQDITFAQNLGVSPEIANKLFSSVKNNLKIYKEPKIAIQKAVSDEPKSIASNVLYSESFESLLEAVKMILLDEIKYMYLHQPGSVTVNAPSVQIATGAAIVPSDIAKPVDPTKPGEKK